MPGDIMKSGYLKLLYLIPVVFFAAALLINSANYAKLESGTPVPETSADPVALMTGENDPDDIPLEFLPGEQIDLNSATLEELERLDGIGEVLADRIIEYREENGPFTDTGEIMNVYGIGEGKYSQIEEYITVGGTSEDTGG